MSSTEKLLPAIQDPPPLLGDDVVVGQAEAVDKLRGPQNKS
jgi:hypothetical protein